MIVGLNHVGISVTDIERSIAFYRSALSMEPATSITEFGPGHAEGKYERIMALPGATGRVCTIAGDGGLRLELFEFVHPVPSRRSIDRPVSDHGISHFCIEVDDIHAEYQRILSAGGVCHCPPLEFFGRVKATYARDLDGNVFELIQKLRVR